MSKGKGGRPRFVLDDKALSQIETLAGYGLTIPQIASVLGCDPATLHRRKADEEAVLQAFTRGRAKAEGMIGKSLFEKAKSGDVQAIRWWETTRAGRSERHTVTTRNIDVKAMSDEELDRLIGGDAGD